MRKKGNFWGNERKTTSSQCSKCRMKHDGDICYRAQGLCYNYGEKGHAATQCPNPKIFSCLTYKKQGHMSRDYPQDRVKNEFGSKGNKNPSMDNFNNQHQRQ